MAIGTLGSHESHLREEIELISTIKKRNLTESLFTKFVKVFFAICHNILTLNKTHVRSE